MALLQLDEVSASYGASQALFGVSFSVEAGETVALLGRNGMGKTTTVRSVCRLLPWHGGTLHFAGRDLVPLAPHRVARLGIGLVPEGRRCFAGLTVQENLIAAARPGEWTLARIHELFPALEARAGQRAASLSGGEQQMVAIARALMTNPQLLVLDEATEGLAPLVRRDIWAVLARLKRETGLSILVIDKSLEELSAIADRAVVLNRGKSVWSGTPGEITPALADRWIGI